MNSRQTHRHRGTIASTSLAFTLFSGASAAGTLASPVSLMQPYGGAMAGEQQISLPVFIWLPLLLLSCGCALWLLALPLLQARQRKVASTGRQGLIRRRAGAVGRWFAGSRAHPRRTHAGGQPQMFGRSEPGRLRASRHFGARR